MKGGREVSESVMVPKVLIAAMADPGETELKPLAAMEALRKFYDEIIRPELKTLAINGGVHVLDSENANSLVDYPFMFAGFHHRLLLD